MENNGRSVSNKELFGLCDDTPPARNPAYIDETDKSKWIGIVDNPNSKPIGFYGIDHCLVLKTGKEEETQQVCDGLLHYDDELIFVELKDRQYRGWVKTGCEQLAATVEHISRTSSFKNFCSVKAYICNRQRPFFSTNYNCHIQDFKNRTGLELKIMRKIAL